MSKCGVLCLILCDIHSICYILYSYILELFFIFSIFLPLFQTLWVFLLIYLCDPQWSGHLCLIQCLIHSLGFEILYILDKGLYDCILNLCGHVLLDFGTLSLCFISLNTTHGYLHHVDNSVCMCVYRTCIWHGISREAFHLLLLQARVLYRSGIIWLLVWFWIQSICCRMSSSAVPESRLNLFNTCLFIVQDPCSSFSSVISSVCLHVFQFIDTSLYPMKPKQL